MNKTICMLVFLALFAGSAVEVASQTAKPEAVTGLISDEALHFLEDFGITFASLPDVRPTERKVMQSLHFGSGADTAQNEVAALYLPSSNEILLDASFDLTDPIAQSYLVHELVHTHQSNAGLDITAHCRGILEAEAYAIQAAFLRRANLPRLALMFDLVGQLQGSCAIKY